MNFIFLKNDLYDIEKKIGFIFAIKEITNISVSEIKNGSIMNFTGETKNNTLKSVTIEIKNKIYKIMNLKILEIAEVYI
jgi:hypothetical protein|nr:MAG TPA: hypothetical protein [Caudoviricetes sp.]